MRPVVDEERCGRVRRALQRVVVLRPFAALDLRAIASFTDFFLIASGANVRQVQAIADGVVEHLRKELNTKPARVEGFNSAEWVLLDYGDFVFHVFEEKARRFYDLERLWRDGARVALPPAVTGGESSVRTEG